METMIDTAAPPGPSPQQLADWAHSVGQAIGARQWHGAWRALIDAALPAATAVQQRLLAALDAWDGFPAEAGADQRQALLQQSFAEIQAAHAAGPAPDAGPPLPRACRVQGWQLVKRYRRGGFTLGPLDRKSVV